MTSAGEIRRRLEGYARAKISSVLHPMSEQILVDQPADPIDYMVRYLVENRQDLRKFVKEETLAVYAEAGKPSLPKVDHPLLDRITELENDVKHADKYRRKEKKKADKVIDKLNSRIKELEDRIVAAGMPLDESLDAEMSVYLAWEKSQLDESPADRKDNASFRYRTYTEVPTFTPQHRSVLTGVLKPADMKAKFLGDESHVMGDMQTNHGFSFSNFIQPGITTPNLRVGVAVGDAECAKIFHDLLIKVTRATHGLDPVREQVESLLNPDLVAFDEEILARFTGNVLSVKIDAIRNVDSLPFPAGATPEHRAETEEVLKSILLSIEDGDLSGEYWNADDLDPVVEDVLEADDLMFLAPEPKSLFETSGAGRDWPQNRGIFFNKDKSLVCWINGEDHVRMISMQRDANIGEAFRRFCGLNSAFETGLKFSDGKKWAVHDEFGFLNTCPSNFGSALRVTVSLSLPTRGKDVDPLHAISEPRALKLTKNDFQLEPPEPSDDEDEDEEETTEHLRELWTLRTVKVFGASETDDIKNVIAAVDELLGASAELEDLPTR